jgi:hypothetical protein
VIDPVLISGGVSALAIVGAAVGTVATLRHQRKGDGQRRRHERHMRLLESGLTAAVDFLAAADRTARGRQALSVAHISLDGARNSSSPENYEHFRAAAEEAQQSASIAMADAESAYAALRLLIPAVADQAHRYLDLCIAANAYPDETQVDRQRARQMVEDTLRSTLGGDSLGSWMLPAQALEGQAPRRRKIPLPRRPERDTAAGAPREP